MNVPTYLQLQAMLAWLGSVTTALGSGSIGLIAAPFTGTPSTTFGSITEANYDGYARQSVGSSTVTFIGSDGNEYVEFNTLRFQPTGSTTPNTIYGLFWTPGNDSTKIWATDALTAQVFFNGPSRQLTITPRMGLNPTANFGINVISS